MNDSEPWINTGRVDPDGYTWSIDKWGFAAPTFVGKPAQGMPSEGPRPKGSGASAPASPVAKPCAQKGSA
jgi:hypothetical protein